MKSSCINCTHLKALTHTPNYSIMENVTVFNVVLDADNKE